MGDINRALGIMLSEGGCDVKLLMDKDGDPVDKMELMFTPTDQLILQQYECGAEPCLLLSKFLQMSGASSHHVLFECRVRIQQMHEPKFLMFADISHTNLEDLGKRAKTEMVLSNQVTDREESGQIEAMHPCIARFRHLFADNFEK